MGSQTLKFDRGLIPGTHIHAGSYKNCHFKTEGHKFNQCTLIHPASLPNFLCWRSLLKNKEKNQDIVFQRKLQLSSNFRKVSFLPVQIALPAWSRVWMWAPWGGQTSGVVALPCPPTSRCFDLDGHQFFGDLALLDGLCIERTSGQAVKVKITPVGETSTVSQKN